MFGGFAPEGRFIETEIEGLDKVLGGGLPEKSQTVITGGPGSGKSFMGMEVLYRCAKRGINSAFVTLDELPDNMVRDFSYAFPSMKDIGDLVKSKKLAVSGHEAALKIETNSEGETAYTMGNLVSDIEGIVKSVEAQVVVVDSLSFLKLMLGKTMLYNKAVSMLVANLRRLDVTSLFMLEVPYYSMKRMKFGQEMILFDGVITLYQSPGNKGGAFEIEIVKMRGADYSREVSHYQITKEGIKLV